MYFVFLAAQSQYLTSDLEFKYCILVFGLFRISCFEFRI